MTSSPSWCSNLTRRPGPDAPAQTGGSTSLWMSNLENLSTISRVILSSQSPVPLLSGGVLIHSRSVEKPRGCPARMGKRKATGSFDVDVLYLASWNIGQDAMPDRAREDPTGEAGQGRAGRT